MTNRCMSLFLGLYHGPVVVARWTFAPSTNVIDVCQVCLDYWLDNADDDPDLEPAALEFLARTAETSDLGGAR